MRPHVHLFQNETACTMKWVGRCLLCNKTVGQSNNVLMSAQEEWDGRYRPATTNFAANTGHLLTALSFTRKLMLHASTA